jgi:hypothetical protein
MKIAINGDIIDTKDIYKITKVQENENEWGKVFYIQFFNKNEIEVAIAYTQFDYNTMKASTQEEANSILIEHKNVTVKKIEDFRQSIIDIWSDNQSDIPQFNL